MQTYPWGANVLPEDRKLTQKIIGNYSGPGGDLTPVPNFYQMFAVEHNKPMAICETGAMFNTEAPATVDAYHMKIKWLEQVSSATDTLAVRIYTACLQIHSWHTLLRSWHTQLACTVTQLHSWHTQSAHTVGIPCMPACRSSMNACLAFAARFGAWESCGKLTALHYAG